MRVTCPICGHNGLRDLYFAPALPIFQNKVFLTEEEAMSTPTGEVLLTHCENCGFVFNRRFNSKIMNYDADYQNEQKWSPYFHNYLVQLAHIFRRLGYEDMEKIVEIGCGKGYFLSLLQENGFKSVIGFDPAYEGDNPLVVKEYFGSQSFQIDADLIVMRHVLEHIENPLDFLRQISKANGTRGDIYIEVPDFRWIADRGAFWDIYHEHCNYFTKQTLCSMCKNATVESTFGGQYLYLHAKLSDLLDKDTIKTAKEPMIFNFVEKIESYRTLLGGGRGISFFGGQLQRVLLS